MLGLIDDQQDLELLGQGGRGRRLLHKPGSGCSRLFDRVGDGAKGAEEARGATGGGGGLGLLRLLSKLAQATLLRCGRAGWSLGRCWSFGRGLGRGRRRGWRCPLLGRGGGSGGNGSRWVRPLEICHVSIGQVRHEATVRETATEEVHDCGWKVGLSVDGFVCLLNFFGCKWSQSSDRQRWVQRDQRSGDERQSADLSKWSRRCLTESCFSVGGMKSRRDRKDGWSDGFSSGPVFKRQLSKAQLSQQDGPCVCGGGPPREPHASSQKMRVCDVKECVSERERCGVAPFCEVLLLSPLYSTFLPPELLQAECAQEMLLSLSAYLTRSLTHALSALFLSLALTRHAVSPSPSALLSSSSYITGYVCVSCCSLVVLRAVCNHWKGFPTSVHKVEFTDGNTIHPALQAPPPSPAIPPLVSTLLLNFPLSLIPPLRAHGCDSE